MDERINPSTIRLESSSHCQLRCPSCPTTTRAIHPAIGSGFLQLVDFRRLLDENPGLHSIELSNYGEIFLNRALPAILRLAFERGISLTAFNGANLNHASDDALDAIVRYGLKTLTCSIDGASSETYRTYRVRGNFEAVIANIRRINVLKREQESSLPALTWQFVVFGHNQHEIPAARALAEELGMVFRLKVSWDGKFSPVRDDAQLRADLGGEFISRAEYREKHGADYVEHICLDLWESPQINFDGKVLGCCRNFWGDFGANAFHDGLASAVNSERMVYARKMLQGELPERPDIPCTSCDLYATRKEFGRWVQR